MIHETDGILDGLYKGFLVGYPGMYNQQYDVWSL